jgi:hypothetical protein
VTEHAPISKFPEVAQADARGNLAEIYDDIEFTLRVPWVPFAIRVMSLFPDFVPTAWQMVKPQISTVYAEKGADLVREASIIPGQQPPDPRPKLRAAGRSDEEIGKISRALVFMHLIADITIAMIRVKQALDGASSAAENKFPVRKGASSSRTGAR